MHTHFKANKNKIYPYGFKNHSCVIYLFPLHVYYTLPPSAVKVSFLGSREDILTYLWTTASSIRIEYLTEGRKVESDHGEEEEKEF